MEHEMHFGTLPTNKGERNETRIIAQVQKNGWKSAQVRRFWKPEEGREFWTPTRFGASIPLEDIEYAIRCLQAAKSWLEEL